MLYKYKLSNFVNLIVSTFSFFLILGLRFVLSLNEKDENVTVASTEQNCISLWVPAVPFLSNLH